MYANCARFIEKRIELRIRYEEDKKKDYNDFCTLFYAAVSLNPEWAEGTGGRELLHKNQQGDKCSDSIPQ